MTQVPIYIPAGSPLWDYSSSGGWQTGVAQAMCNDSAGCLVKLAPLQYCEVNLSWGGVKRTNITAAIDGQPVAVQGKGGAKIPVTQGQHVLQVQVAQGGSFAGASITTQLPGQNGNYTMDDAAKSITYTGFTSNPGAPTQSGIETGKQQQDAGANTVFYKGTISYTSSSSATASFSFTSSLIQVYGPVGPAFGTFSVTVDQTDCGTYSATRQEDSGGAAVLLWMGQFSPGQHQVQLRNMQDGQSLALDYMRADGQAGPDWRGGEVKGKPVYGQPVGPFPGDKSEGKSSIGGIIGGVLAALFVLLALLLWWRLHKYRKAGGEGSTLVACFGGARKPAAPDAGPGPGEFKIWPMIRSRPKYAT